MRSERRNKALAKSAALSRMGGILPYSFTARGSGGPMCLPGVKHACPLYSSLQSLS